MWKINELKLFPVTLSQSLIYIPPSTKPMKIIIKYKRITKPKTVWHINNKHNLYKQITKSNLKLIKIVI